MHTYGDYIRTIFANHLESQMSLADYLPDQIAEAANKIAQCILDDGKILVCANGASIANALHFSHALMQQYMVELPALPVILLAQDQTILSTSANMGEYAHVFSRQIQALGNEKDLLIILTTSDDSNSLVYAIDAAKEKGLDVVLLSGPNTGVLSNHIGPEDFQIRVTLNHPARIRETHLFILHCFCDLIDQALFGATHE